MWWLLLYYLYGILFGGLGCQNTCDNHFQILVIYQSLFRYEQNKAMKKEVIKFTYDYNLYKCIQYYINHMWFRSDHLSTHLCWPIYSFIGTNLVHLCPPSLENWYCSITSQRTEQKTDISYMSGALDWKCRKSIGK